MLSTMASKIVRRAFATTRLTALEEFPHKALLQGAAKAAAFQESTAGNGIKLLSKEHSSSMVALKFSMLSGSSRETEDQQGAAEYLSAGAFSGSKTSSGVRTVRSLESLGAGVDVRAGREHVTYSVSVLPDKVGQAVEEVLSAIAAGPADAYVLSEIHHDVDMRYKALEADATMQLSEAVHEAAFGETSGLGASRFAVNPHTVDAKNVLAYRSQHFNAKNLVVASSGIAHAELSAIIDRCSKGMNASNVSAATASPFVGGEARIRKDLHGETHVAVAFPVPAGADSNPYAVLHQHVNHTLRGSGASAFVHTYKSGGLWGISTSAHGADQVNAQLSAAVAAIKAVASGAANVEAAKMHVSVARLSAFESSHEDAAQVLLKAHRNGVDATSYCTLANVSAASVQAAAKASLGAATVAYAAIGKTTAAPSFSAVQKMLK